MFCAASWTLRWMLPRREASGSILSPAQKSLSLLGPDSQFWDGRSGLGCGTAPSGPQRPHPALWRNKSGGLGKLFSL